MTNVKLHINITQGIIDAEGDEEFVWRVYEDFRDRLGAIPHVTPIVNEVEEEADDEQGPPTPDAKPKKRQQKRRVASSSAQSTSNKEKPIGITTYRPQLLPDLDTLGIKEFLAQYKLTSNHDTIVVMTRYLETKGIKPATLDAYFTCYKDAGLKIPVAFGQTFVNIRNEKRYIEFSGPHDITLSTRGDNHLDHGGIKKAEG